MIRVTILLASALLFGAAQAAESPRVIKDCADCPDMIVVPAGRFTMGSPQPGPGDEVDADTGETWQLAVTIDKPFALGKVEVTRAAFARFIAASGYKPVAGCRVWADGWVQDPSATWQRGPQRDPRADFEPVVCVSWHDAQAYAAWLAKRTGKPYRLPSESEWEYAARAGTTTPRPYGNNSFEGVSISLACDNGNVFDIAGQATHMLAVPYARCNDRFAALAPVSSFTANAFGLYDMIGNAAEWVADCYTSGYWGRPPDGRAWIWQGGCETRGVRGGSWASRPADARSAKRAQADPTTRTTTLGFRIARDLTPEDQ